MHMVSYAVVLLLIAAAGGLYMAARIFGNAFPPVAVAVAHGALAASGLVLAIVAAMASDAVPLVKYGAGILFLAALGGFFLLSFHLRKVPHPKGVVVLHALIAVAGVGCLALTLL
jgi:hypothetical protein